MCRAPYLGGANTWISTPAPVRVPIYATYEIRGPYIDYIRAAERVKYGKADVSRARAHAAAPQTDGEGAAVLDKVEDGRDIYGKGG